MRRRRAGLILCGVMAGPSCLAAAAASELPIAGVAAHRNLAYVSTNAHERHRLDIFVPTGGSEALPLIVWVHGGAWQSGSKEDCPPMRSGFAQRGFVVASVNYRLSSHAPFPAQIEDCKAAIRWLRKQADDFRIDPDRIGVWGSSAGGHLVALLGTGGDDRMCDVGENLEFPSAVQAVCDYYGPTDFTQMNAHRPPGANFDHDGADSPESRLIGGPVQAAENHDRVQRANPISYVNAGDPPFLIVHGDCDVLVPHHQSELLHSALVGANVPVHFITVHGGGHGDRFPHAELNRIVEEFFEQQLTRGVSQEVAARPTRSTIEALAGDR